MTIKSTYYSAALAAGLLLPAMTLPMGALAQNQTPVSGAQAQTTAPTGAPKPAPTGASKAGAPKAKATAAKPVSRTDRVEQHIGELHTQLRITGEQQGQWDQFAQVMRENAKNMDQALDQRGSGFANMNAADDLQSYAQIAQQHAQDTQKLATAFQMLYGSMSDDQKKNADTVFRARGEHPGHKKG